MMADFVDQRGIHMLPYPMLPLLVAAEAIHEDKKAPPRPAGDVTTDRSALHKLLHWLLKSSKGKNGRGFRIEVEFVGTKTIVLSRCRGENCAHPVKVKPRFRP
jgi:hypothetical protein